MRQNRINIIEAIYRTKPEVKDEVIRDVTFAIFGKAVSLKTLSVWKSKLRKEGVRIPDRRSPWNR